MLAKLLLPLFIAVAFFGPTIPPAWAYKSLKVPEAYPKVSPYYPPAWKGQRGYARSRWRFHGTSEPRAMSGKTPSARP